MKKSRNNVTAPPQITGKEILAAREELGLTQQQLADLFGVAMMTVSRWETDQSPALAPGAIRMALEYLKMQRVLDHSALLRTLDERRAEIDAFSERLERGREEFERSLTQEKMVGP
jgi:transcriptional regulator with XRE-family HTH domain